MSFKIYGYTSMLFLFFFFFAINNFRDFLLDPLTKKAILIPELDGISASRKIYLFT